MRSSAVRARTSRTSSWSGPTAGPAQTRATPTSAGSATRATVSGRRSDTIMVLRNDRRTGTASLLSIPRDLWVDIPGHGTQRINSAYNHGPEVLVETVQGLGIPVHHYIEIDFVGFKNLIDAVGGYEQCELVPGARHAHRVRLPGPGLLRHRRHTGTRVCPQPLLRAVHRRRVANATAAPTSAAPQRQREFVKKALQQALDEVKANPFRVGDVAGPSRRVDQGRRGPRRHGCGVLAARRGRRTSRPTSCRCAATEIDGNAVLELTGGAEDVLAYFRGDAPAPAG